ncbi:MAG: PASTA domain-containing protein, partial [Weeksellaceae bacterium]|nr:PASTA domain-containing protein [Weeksellaceae bacterium]
EISDWIFSRTPKEMPYSPKIVNIKREIESDTGIKPDYELKNIPDLVGKNGRDVIPALENMGLEVIYNGIGKVKDQSIPPGTPFKKGEIIYLTLKS